MTTHPHVFCRLETKAGLYNTLDYEIHQERQRPVLCELVFKEPVGRGEIGVLELGYLDRLSRHCVLRVRKCSQLAEETFLVSALEPVRQILDSEFIEQMTGVDIGFVLRKIAGKFGLSVVFAGALPNSIPRNLIFLGNVRNALDQLWRIFELKRARWAIDLIEKKFIFLPEGKLPIPPIKDLKTYFKREHDGGIEINIIPGLKPYLPVLWRGEERIVDIVRLNNKTRTQFITFADAEEL